jgi:hypothetical protein
MSVSNFMDDSVAVVVRTWTNVGGVRTATTATTTTKASVQDMKPARQVVHGIDAGAIGYTLYFASDPACGIGDLITWDSRTLAVLGPVQATRRNRAFMVECKEVVG